MAHLSSLSSIILAASAVFVLSAGPVLAKAQSEPAAEPVETTAETPAETPDAAPAEAADEAPAETADEAPAEAADEAPEETEAADPGNLDRKFYKGELGSPGAPELKRPNDAFFAESTYWLISGQSTKEHYLTLNPELDLHFDVMDGKKLTMRFEAPISILVLECAPGSDGGVSTCGVPGDGMRLRAEDWDEPGDFMKVIREIKLGRKEERFFLNVGRLYGVSLGHGTVMRRYTGNLDPDRNRLGAQLDMYNDYAGFESFIADAAFQTQVMGGLAFVKPLSFFSDNAMAKSLSFGVHYTTDLSAPMSLTKDDAGQPILNDVGYHEYEAGSVGIMGFDVEFKPIKLGNYLDVKLYADYSMVSTVDDPGAGMTAGMLLRSNLGSGKMLNALRIRLEGRQYDSNYIPEYFNSLYEVQKFYYDPSGWPTDGDVSTLPTKASYLELEKTGEKHSSWYAEATYAWVDRLVIGGAIEQELESGLYNALFQVEVPAIEYLRLYLSYQWFGLESFGDVMSTVQDTLGLDFNANSVFTAQARWMVLSFFFLRGGLEQRFRINPDTASYENELNFMLGADVGWEFN